MVVNWLGLLADAHQWFFVYGFAAAVLIMVSLSCRGGRRPTEGPQSPDRWMSLRGDRPCRPLTTGLSIRVKQP